MYSFFLKQISSLETEAVNTTLAINGRVLVADDDKALRRLYALALRNEGFDVTTAEDGEDAISKFIDVQPEVVLLDYNMPGKKGLDAALEIFRMKWETKIIILTAEPAIHEEVERSGVIDSLLLKPISVERLVDSIGAVASQKRT